MASLEAQAKNLGIPMEMQVDDGTRYSYCSAHMATLVSIEGTQAVYKGQCANQHVYEAKFEIEELKKMVTIENGELVFGQKKGFVSEGLEDF